MEEGEDLEEEARPAEVGQESEEPPLITEDMLAREAKRESRVDFEKGMSYAPRLTLVLILANAAVFAWEMATGALADEQSIIAAGALQRASVLNGEVWRLVSSMFLHGGPGHLIGNCVVLYILGMACEHAQGWRQTMLIYGIGGLCGSVLSVVFSSGPSVGASGAVFGVMAAVIVFFYKYQKSFYLRDKRVGFVLLVWALYQIGGGFFTPYIDNFAHIGGFVGGGILGLRLRPALLSKSVS